MIPKFRGMDVTGNWYEGNLAIIPKRISHVVDAGSYISNSAGMPFAYQVRPETVGQSTGLKDSKGVEIFEGDIIKDPKSVGVVGWLAPMFIVQTKPEGEYWNLGAGLCYPPDKNQLKETEIIGNIHENPELIEDK